MSTTYMFWLNDSHAYGAIAIQSAVPAPDFPLKKRLMKNTTSIKKMLSIDHDK